MPNHPAVLDKTFQALSDPTRRGMLERLMRGPATVTELTRPLSISLPSAMQHLAILEAAGLIASRKVGRVRTCRMQRQALAGLTAWLDRQRAEWENRLDRLERYMDELETKDPAR